MSVTANEADRLEAFLELAPKAVVETDRDVIGAYARDQCAFGRVGVPGALARPRNSSETSAVLTAAHRVGLPVVPRGAGTGLSGGANAIDGCLILSLASLDEVVEINTDDLIAVVQPGVVNAELKRAVERHGLWYPPDPASQDSCTIGGNIATNAGGLCCTKYGMTREYVLGLEVLLVDGSTVRFGRRSPKGVVGLDLTSLMVGSEGVLGVITEATLRLVPKPGDPRTAIAYFASAAAAGRAVSVLARNRIRPSMLEILDRATLRAVEAFRRCDLDLDAAALLIAQTDLPGPAGEHEVATIARLLESSGATWAAHTDDPSDSEQFVMARKMAYPALEHLGPALLDDVCVPLSRVGTLIERINEIADETGTDIATFGHAGDGNLHPTIVVKDFERAYAAFAKIVAAAQALGGTATGEHGVGSLKIGLTEGETHPIARHLQSEIKAVFDPKGTLNPGKCLPATSDTRAQHC